MLFWILHMPGKYSLKNLKPKDQAIISRTLIFSKSRGAKKPNLFNDTEFMVFPNTYGEFSALFASVNNNKYVFDTFVNHCVKAISENPALDTASSEKIITALRSSPYAIKKQDLIKLIWLGITFFVIGRSLLTPDLSTEIEGIKAFHNTEPEGFISRVFYNSLVDKQKLIERDISNLVSDKLKFMNFIFSTSIFISLQIIYSLGKSFGISKWLESIEEEINKTSPFVIKGDMLISRTIIGSSTNGTELKNKSSHIKNILDFMHQTIDKSIYAFDNIPQEDFPTNVEDLLLSFSCEADKKSIFEDFINFCSITINFSTNLSAANILKFESSLYNSGAYINHDNKISLELAKPLSSLLQFIIFSGIICHPKYDEIQSKYCTNVKKESTDGLVLTAMIFLALLTVRRCSYERKFLEEHLSLWLDSMSGLAQDIALNETIKNKENLSLRYKL